MSHEHSYCLTSEKSSQESDSDIDFVAITFKVPNNVHSKQSSPRILSDKIGPKINKDNMFQTLIKDKCCVFEDPIVNDGDCIYFDSKIIQLEPMKSVNNLSYQSDQDIENDAIFNESLLSEGFNSTRD